MGYSHRGWVSSGVGLEGLVSGREGFEQGEVRKG